VKFNLYCNQQDSSRAPGKVYLEKYEFTGTTEASTRTEAIRNWYQMSKTEEGVKEPKVGDLLSEEGGQTLILTPQGLWSVVEVIE